MKIDHPQGGALDPGLLTAWRDDALDEAESAAVREHVSYCDACRREVAALDARARRVSRALEAADPAPPADAAWNDVLETARRAPSRRRLRKAAGWILAVTAAGALATSPVRAWIGDRLNDLVREVETQAVSTSGAAGSGASLRFQPGSSALDVVVETRQAGGSLVVRFGSGETARVAVTGGGDERLTVGRAVRISNPAGSAASYALDVPPPVDRVTVRVGGNAPVVLDRDAAVERPAVIDLATGRVRIPGTHDDD